MFDKDKDGFLIVEELKKFMTTLGDKMNAREVEDMVKVIFKEKDELVECEGIHIV